ncbi:MAG TPA: phosphoglycerate dehydrogenase [Thermoleophilaceae bacterium]|nr:phosphoglycerate dehydrogenase [Thermoleophilaceae bacterium]
MATAEPTRVLLSVSSFGAGGDQDRRKLEDAGMEVLDNPHGRRLTRDEIGELIGDVHALVAGTEPLDLPVLEQASRLRVISRVGVGLENVDLNAARSLGIVVRNTPDAVTDPVAELTLAGMLSLLRHIGEMDRALRAGSWERKMGGLLRGKTVGIVGLGRIGRRLTELLAPFEVTVLASDRAPDQRVAGELGATYVELDELLERSDIVTLHVPGMTRPLIGADELARMQPHALLVNASRGGLVDEDALLAALHEGRLAGAYVDTFVDEPYTGPLTELEQVLVTPHAGSYAREARARMESEAVDNLLGALEEFR